MLIHISFPLSYFDIYKGIISFHKLPTQSDLIIMFNHIPLQSDELVSDAVCLIHLLRFTVPLVEVNVVELGIEVLQVCLGDSSPLTAPQMSSHFNLSIVINSL